MNETIWIEPESGTRSKAGLRPPNPALLRV
jgi:hypothetical protein